MRVVLFVFLFLLSEVEMKNRDFDQELPQLFFRQGRQKEDDCSPCQPGTASNGKDQQCGDCDAGSCVDGTSCPPCPSGQYASKNGSKTCEKCRAGTESSFSHTTCIPCPPGTSNPDDGGTCKSCPMGTYAFGVARTQCDECPPGKYEDGEGASVCKNCGVGFYLNETGATNFTDCEECPEGSYCPSTSTPEPIECPRDHKCGPGTSNPKHCKILFSAPPGSDECSLQEKRLAYYLTGLFVFVIVSFLILFVFRRKTRAEEEASIQYEASSRDDSSVLIEKNEDIPEAMPGPVYGGF
eukprot:CAMPEP_0201492304 /NCGR_PEP_ID=MMETSP0151_2-20130828/32584_1 /ASSEMBLY_ACC=CAM_ASM_000257 /TAXON_ID=200890 /ORGANISM="Paramoeba atlantica, Strain 621/1 / CCAP 1560/9" /LENGTH=295 /DNA_ID=CAMNT_0047879039 /DNA_START=63 /DNA_END=950 /DNA_ORIENTATION=+